MNLGIAFSGGGVRSAAELGIMQAFYQNDIKPTIFAGSSGGSIVATLLALGIEPKRALELFKETHDILDVAYLHILAGMISKQKIQGIFKGDRLEKALDIIFDGKTLSEVKSRLAIITTNILDGKQIIYSNNLPLDIDLISDKNVHWNLFFTTLLKDIVRASCGLPAVFLPKKIDQYVLVDGGLVNNLPSDVCLALGADRVITIDLGSPSQAYELGGVYSILAQSFNIIYTRDMENNERCFDIHLNPKVYNVGILDFTEIDDCFNRGYNYGLSIAETVKDALQNNKKNIII